MALTQVSLSLQTACPRPRGTRTDTPDFLRALGARPKNARSEYGPSKRGPRGPRDPPHFSCLTPVLSRIWIVHTVHKTSAPAALPSPVSPSLPHLTLGHPGMFLDPNVTLVLGGGGRGEKLELIHMVSLFLRSPSDISYHRAAQ